MIDVNDISKKISVIETSLDWGKQFKTASEFAEDKKKLIRIRRELNKIKYATSENCSVAAFGESQMGKSYLVSAMLSEPGKPFLVKDGNKTYNFIDEINPSEPGDKAEATGVVTRFTQNVKKEDEIEGFVKAQLLSITDIVLILCEAYYSNMKHTPESIWSSEKINDKLAALSVSQNTNNFLLNEDDILDIQEYIRELGNNSSNVYNSKLFDYLLQNVTNLTKEQLKEVLKYCWYDFEGISNLWEDLFDNYEKLSFANDIYVEFPALLRKHGTLLGVKRLDEMYGERETTVEEYQPIANIKLNANSPKIQIKKSFLSALIAELRIRIPKQEYQQEDNTAGKDSETVQRTFLKDLDILDFPGARRPEQDKEESTNIGTIYRRGKVTYLFNKYAKAKRIKALLFCHNHEQSSQSTLGDVLKNWVDTLTIENTASARERLVQSMGGSPLFIISTYFNVNLEHITETKGTNLSTRWQNRFENALEKEVLKTYQDNRPNPNHWFHNWTVSNPEFNNIYMLRDFKFSKHIYSGYDIDTNTPEKNEIIPDKYPEFLKDLKSSFIQFDFVQKHFSNPSKSWDEAAQINHDGTTPIIESLNRIAPKVKTAIEQQFAENINDCESRLVEILKSHYHSENVDEEIVNAKKMAAKICLSIDTLCGKDAYFFGRLLDRMMIPESRIYEIVFEMQKGMQQPLPISGAESEILMNAGVTSDMSNDEKIEKLKEYLCADNYQECAEMLAELGVDIEKLLAKTQMQKDPADTLVTRIETLWHQEYLSDVVAHDFADEIPLIDKIVENLWHLYQMLQMHQCITKQVKFYFESLNPNVIVGIVSDYLASIFNQFVSTFGFKFMSEDALVLLSEKNSQLKLNLQLDLLNDVNRIVGIKLLEQLDAVQSELARNEYTLNARNLQMQLPQFNSRWQWEQRLRAGFVYSCQIPNYDIDANNKMRNILETLNK